MPMHIVQLMGTEWKAQSVDSLQWSFFYGDRCVARDILGDELEAFQLLKAYRADELGGYWTPDYLTETPGVDGNFWKGMAWATLFSALIVAMVIIGVAIARRSVA